MNPLPADISGRSYEQCISALAAVALDMLHEKVQYTKSEILSETINIYQARLDQIKSDAQPHLRDMRLCKSLTKHEEHLAFRLQFSYISSELYRPALRTPTTFNGNQHIFEKTCIKHLETTIESSIELYRLSYGARRMWEFAYPTISSALLLGTIAKLYQIHNVANLITRVVKIISDNPHLAGRDTDSPTEETSGANTKVVWLLQTLLDKNMPD